MNRWIIENQRYNHDFLSRPSAQAMKKAGTTRVMSISPKRQRRNAPHKTDACFAHRMIGLLETGEPMSIRDAFIALYVTTSYWHQMFRSMRRHCCRSRRRNWWPACSCEVFSTTIERKAFKYDLAYYSEQCEIPQIRSFALAKRFTSYGTKAVVDTHGGNMHTNGFYNSFSILMLNALISNINAKGGAIAKAEAAPTVAKALVTTLHQV